MKLFYVSVSYRLHGDKKRTRCSGGAIAETREEAIAKAKEDYGSLPASAKEVEWYASECENGAFLLSPRKGV